VNRRSRIAFGVAAVWAVFALLETIKTYASLRAAGDSPVFVDIARFNIPWWAVWGLLTWPAVWIASRLPVDDSRGRARALAAHLIAGCVIAVAHIVIAGAYYHAMNPAAPNVAGTGDLIARWLNAYVIANIATYAGIVGAFYTVQYAERYRGAQITAAALEAERERVHRRMVEARLHALQRELDPHFLFNTLNAIGALVRRQDTKGALHVLAQLGDLLRDSLTRGSRLESPLRAEMAILQRYFDIERTRFGDRLRVDVHVPVELDEALVPTFSLQPLVENAIRHGVARTTAQSFVSVEAARDDCRIVVTIRNTGAKAGDVPPGEGVGLGNTRARLSQLYGAEAALVLAIEPDGEATATLTVPYHTEPVLAATEAS
jgi:hypothetical protein